MACPYIIVKYVCSLVCTILLIIVNMSSEKEVNTKVLLNITDTTLNYLFKQLALDVVRKSQSVSQRSTQGLLLRRETVSH